MQKIKHPPRSVFDPNAALLIREVLDNKNKKQGYERAYQMVKSGKAHPDGHDAGENTLLTECVKRGTLQDVEFVMDKLGASGDTSCDCPDHNTPLIYSAIVGDPQKTEALLKRNVTVNLINKKGETALDIAVNNSNNAVQTLLRQYGGEQHVTLEGCDGWMAKIKGKTIGYSANERILLLERAQTMPQITSSVGGSLKR